MTQPGWLPMLTRVTGEVMTAETINRYVHNANWCASEKAFGAAPFRTVRFAGDVVARWWFEYHGPTLHYRINVVGLGGGAWGIAVNGETVKAASTDTGVRITDGGSPNETPIDLTTLTTPLVVGQAYEIQVIIGSSTAPDVRVEYLYTTGVPSTYTWTALPTFTDGGTPTAAQMDILRTDLEFLREHLNVPRVPVEGIIHEAEPYNDWTPGDSDAWRAGYQYVNHGDTETSFWAGYVRHVSDSLAFAIQGWVKTTRDDTAGTVRVYADGTLVGTLNCTKNTTNATPWTWNTGFSGDTTILWAEPGNTGAVTVYALADISSLSLAEDAWYQVEVTYQMETGLSEPWDYIAPPDRFDVSTWYVLEVDGAVPSSYTPPTLWEPCDEWRGSTGDPNLGQITAALTDLYARVPSHVAIAVFQQRSGPLFWQRRRRWLRYGPFGDVLAYGGDVTSVDATRPPEDVELPDENPGTFDLSVIPVGDLVALRGEGSLFYAWERSQV